MVLIDERVGAVHVLSYRGEKQKDISPNNPRNLRTICESNLHYLLCDQMKTSTDQLGYIYLAGNGLCVNN